MKVVTLGQTNLNISCIGLGGLQFGGHFGAVSRFEVMRIVEASLDGGITLFDTSPAYGGGLAEELLGDSLRYVSEKVVIATKIGAGIDSSGRFWALNSRSNILRQIDGSLSRLRRDQIDIYMIPGSDPTTDIGETMATMEELRSRGKIKFIGFCTSRADHLRSALKSGRVDVVQASYSVLNRAIEAELVPFCRATHIPIMACEPYCRGLLAGLLHKHSSFDADDLRIEDKRFRGDRYRDNIETANRLRTFAEQEGFSLVQLAVGWIRQNPAITSVLCGAKNRLQIRQSIIASGVELTPEQVMDIDQIVGADVLQQASDLP